MTTTTAQIAYRKTRTGEWVAYGPLADLADRVTVTVAKKDGTAKVEAIDHLGKPFAVAGVEMVYAYLEHNTPARKTTSYERSERCYRGHTHPVAGCHDCHDTF